jgi:hypothetical protein
VSLGQELHVQASHDTYSITFSIASTGEVSDEKEGSRVGRATKEASSIGGDPVLVVARERAQPLCTTFAKALAQDPIAARTAATLGMQLAAQAGRMGGAEGGGSAMSVDGAAAAEFAVMLCSS